MLLIITSLIICILSAAEVDIFVPGLMDIQEEFNISSFMAQFSLSANFIAYCVCSLIAGVVGDKYNRRSVILYSLVIFIVGSALCCWAGSFSALLIGRILQGIGIAGPASLGYVIIADQYSVEKQTAILGLLHGVITFVMAGAPVIGSVLTYNFGWRSNFSTLMSMGIVCFILTWFFVPQTCANSNDVDHVSLSFRSYLPFLTSKEFMIPVFALCAITVTFWVFVGFAPLFYMDDLGVTVSEFGYYQGALALTFSLSSIASGIVMRWFGAKKVMIIGCSLCAIHAILILILALLDVRSPLLITLFMMIASAGVVYPINILYPIALIIIKNGKSRAASLINALRLFISSLGLCIVGALHNGTFLYLGLWISIVMTIGLFILCKKRECRSLWL